MRHLLEKKVLRNLKKHTGMILISKWLPGTNYMICHNLRPRSQKSLTECHISVKSSLFDCLFV